MYERSLYVVKNRTRLEQCNSNPTGKIRLLVRFPSFLCILDQLLEPFIVDIVYGPLRHLVSREISSKLHLE